MLSSSMMVWLRSFDAVARHSSFTRAADELCISQGAVSQQVKHLEDALSCPLFYREPRSIQLTSSGARLYDVTRDMFRTLDATLTQLRQGSDDHHIALSCSPSFAMGWLTSRLGHFFRQHASIHLKIQGEFHELSRANLARDGLNAAVRYDLGKYVDLEARPFLDEWLFPVASPEFLDAHPTLKQPQHLRGEWLLHDSSPWDGASQFEEWEYWLTQIGCSIDNLQGGHFFNLSQMAMAAAVNGQGVAMGRLALIREELVSGRLVDIFGVCVPSAAKYVFVTPSIPSGSLLVVERWLRAESADFLENCRGVVSWLPKSSR